MTTLSSRPGREARRAGTQGRGLDAALSPSKGGRKVPPVASWFDKLTTGRGCGSGFRIFAFGEFRNVRYGARYSGVTTPVVPAGARSAQSRNPGPRSRRRPERVEGRTLA